MRKILIYSMISVFFLVSCDQGQPDSSDTSNDKKVLRPTKQKKNKSEESETIEPARASRDEPEEAPTMVPALPANSLEEATVIKPPKPPKPPRPIEENAPENAPPQVADEVEEPSPVVAPPPVNDPPLEQPNVVPEPATPGPVVAPAGAIKNVVLYGNPNCGFCKASESLLRDKGIPYEFKNVFADTALLIDLHAKIGAKTFPYVFIDGKYIGGFMDLQGLLNKPVSP